VTASRGKDDMEDSTLNEVRDSIGGVVHELPPPPMLLAQGSGHGSRTAAHPRRHCAKGHGLGCSSRYLQRSDGNSCRIGLVHQILEFVPPLGDVCRDLAIAARSEAASPRRCDQDRVNRQRCKSYREHS
jgi:hypothetical protein